MRFDVAETLAHPLDLVFSTHRDRLVETVPFLEEVERLECQSIVRHASGTVEQVHLWHGSPKVLPLLLRALVPAHLLQWRQHTFWDPAERVARWEIAVPGLGTAVESSGTNTYAAAGAGTRITIDGSFAFHPDRVEGLSQAIPASAVPIVERVVVGMIVPMVKRTGAAVAQLLDQPPRR
jgi:hypothetical protein